MASSFLLVLHHSKDYLRDYRLLADDALGHLTDVHQLLQLGDADLRWVQQLPDRKMGKQIRDVQ